MMSVGVGGYMEQWIGMADIDGHATKEGAAEVQADTEIFFKGSLAADNGLTFSVDVQLEGTNNAGNYIDESSFKITGDFGDIRIGAEDTASNLMHYAHEDVGIGFSAGDTSNWLGFGTPSTYGSGSSAFADIPRVTYFTPRMSGVQIGASYTPDATLGQAAQNGKATTNNNDMDSMSVGLNYQGAIGDSSVAFSAGYHSQATAMDDDATYTNFGLQVGMGAFGFNVAYAEADAGDGSDADETVTAGLKYAQGEMAFSLGYGMLDSGDGSEMTSVMLSTSYALAPGVEARASFFQAEEGDMEGAGFVGGFKVGF